MARTRRAPLVLERTAQARERVRARMLGKIPRWYSPLGHLGATVGVSLVVLVVTYLKLDHVRPLEWLVVPAAMLLANLLEYRVHKYMLHRRRFPFQHLYDRHTPEHHAIYQYDDMAIRSTKEFRLVLIPAIGVAGLVVATVPFAALFGAVFGRNAGLLFLTTAACMMVSYEVLHLTYHLPPDSFIGRRRVIRFLREHHARHHDPRLMNKYNFNVTVPFFDWVMGTTYHPDVDAIPEESAPAASGGARAAPGSSATATPAEVGGTGG